jgi:hypothetical protein
MAATIAIPVCTATSNSAALLCHRRAAHAARPPAPAPLLQGLGRIALPLSAEQAEALRSVAAQAPHGQGAATVVDRSVRRCWQLEPAQVQLGASWQSKVERAVKLAAGGLGLPTQSMQVRTDFVASLTQDMAGCCVRMLQRHACGPLRGLQSARPAPAVAFPCPSCLPSSSLQAELYKVLLYEPGDFFLPHRDTEKAPGMVATLVITLPSVYSGGRLRVRHGGVEKTFGGGSGGLAAAAAAAGAEAGAAAGAGGGCSYAAFYADCEHEVEPLMAGHRLALAYNLIHVSAAVELSCQAAAAVSLLPVSCRLHHFINTTASACCPPLCRWAAARHRRRPTTVPLWERCGALWRAGWAMRRGHRSCVICWSTSIRRQALPLGCGHSRAPTGQRRR